MIRSDTGLLQGFQFTDNGLKSTQSSLQRSALMTGRHKSRSLSSTQL